MTLLTDIPTFRPVKELPANVKIIGPIFWDGGSKLPDWADKINNNTDLIYVSAGGTGDKKLFRKILQYLKKTDLTIVATTGNTLKPEEVNVSYKNLFISDYLPGEFILKKAKLIIFPGGNATCYQSLSFGVPQILTPLHLDQEDNANQLERLGTGIMINPYTDLNEDNLIAAIDRIMTNRRYKQNSVKLSNVLKTYNGAKLASDIIKDY